MTARPTPRQRPGAPPRVAYTVREVSASTGLGYRTVLALIKSGRLRAIKGTKSYVVPKAALDEFIEQAS
jgi:excisionase family DNA binding protein